MRYEKLCVRALSLGVGLGARVYTYNLQVLGGGWFVKFGYEFWISLRKESE